MWQKCTSEVPATDAQCKKRAQGGWQRSFFRLENIMNARIFTGSIFGACILVLAFGIGAAQATGNTAPQASSATAATNNGASASGESKATMHKHSQHHATSHNSSHTHHKHMTSATTGSDQETAYRAALKSCVEEPATQRDNCLNDAIVRFGRS